MKNKTKIKPVNRPGKKGTIGSTITWFAAAFLIFFILILFILANGVVSVRYASNRPDYSIIGDEAHTADLASVKTLPVLLSMEKDGKTIEEHILEWADYANNYVTLGQSNENGDLDKQWAKKGFLEKEISKILDQLSSKTRTYSFYIKYGKFIQNPFDGADDERGFAIIRVQKNLRDIDWKSRSTHFVFQFDVIAGAYIEDNPQIEGYFYLGE